MMRLLLLLCFSALAIPCCASHVVTDELGHSVTVPDHPHRIVCLTPAITDTVFSLGAADDVAAVTDFVHYPVAATKKPSVGSISDPSLEAMLALHPDLVLATPLFTQQAILDRLTHLNIPVFLVEPHGVAGILRSVTDVGHAIGRDSEAAKLVASLQQRIAAVRARVQGQPVISVFRPISYDPVITMGKGAFSTELIDIAGGYSITADLPQEWTQIGMEAVIARAPQALLMTRNGKITLAMLRTRPGWNTLPAVRDGRVYWIDFRFELPSPVAIDALEDLARQFHP
jgi:iron complex transport system substrate-binding protein